MIIMPAKKLIYVIHEHFSRKHHWDLRLEHEGVLKSWALPKSPMLKEGEKRLAIEVEDHSLEYAKFEGEIPEGSYGAGLVRIWDSGTFSAEKFSSKEIIFEISGKKLKGKFALIRMKEKNWLFFRKKKQEF